MITLIDGLPEHVIGLLGEGDITAEDYEQVVVPAIASSAETGHKVSLLYVLNDGAGYDAGAIWEDTKVGINHLSSLDRIAVVTDDGRYRAAIKLVGAFMPGRVRVYGHDERAAAQQWVSGATS